MSSPLDEKLNQMMKKTLDSFYLSVSRGGAALTSFLGTWTTFDDTFRLHHDELHQDTLASVQDLASILNSFVATVMHLEDSREKILNESISDLSEILEKGMENLSIKSAPVHKPSGSHPPYLEAAYHWLINNLHNPYPSKEFKKSIARNSNTSLKDIDAWFTDVRKRIGWNKLRKTRFSNKQEKIIAASTRFFKPTLSSFSDDLTTTLISEMESNEVYHAEFSVMARKAKSLYSGKFLDANAIPAHDASIRRSGVEKTKQFPPQPSNLINDRSSVYPTPEPSPGRSAEPSPLTFPSPLPDSQDQHLSRKRPRSPLGGSEDNLNLQSSRPYKRGRVDEPPLTHETGESLSLPSPAHSVNDCQEEDPKFIDESPSPILAAPLPKRKRRLSEGDGQAPPKRPRHALQTPRLQTVSDPFPTNKSSTEVNERYVQPRDYLSGAIPPPVHASDFYLHETLLDVDFFHHPFQTKDPLSGTSSIDDLDNDDNTFFPSNDILPAHEALFVDPFQDLIYTNTDKLQFDLVAAPSHQFTLNCDVDVSDNLSTLHQVSGLHCPGYIPDDPLLLEIPSTNFVEQDFPHLSVKAAVLGNFNYTTSHFSNSSEHLAKRARVQALREELALYEAEGL